MEPVELAAPPRRASVHSSWVTVLLPLVGSLGTVALIAGGGPRQAMLALALGGATLLAVLAQAAASAATRRRDSRAAREAYRRHLEGTRARLLTSLRADRAACSARHPPPLVRLTCPPPPQRDSLVARWGIGLTDLPVAGPPEDPHADPVAAHDAAAFVRTHSTVEAVDTLDLGTTRHLRLPAPAVRALVVAAAATLPPGVLRVESHGGGEEWDWIALLPHHSASGHLLIVVDGLPAPPSAEGVTVLEIDPASATSGADMCGPALAAATARTLGRIHETRPTTSLGPLQATLGSGDDGQPVTLDLREASDGGAGPHGLLVGATGSGKSELLRAIVGDLVVASTSADLRLALVDFKGGATFQPFAGLPHVTAYVTNLDDDRTLIRRLDDALCGELDRRQRELRAAGAASVREHPLPRLVVVVDEFTELVEAEPDLLATFVRIGRLGRSLGVHLLISSQRLDEGRLRELDAHLSYRIALRTFTSTESHAVLGNARAAELPLRAGSGFVRTAEGLIRFSGHDPTARLPHGAGVERIRRGQAGRTGKTRLEQHLAQARGPAAPALWLPPLGPSPGPMDLGDAPPLQARIGWVDLPREQRQEPLSIDLSTGHVAVVGGPRAGKSTALRSVAIAIRRSTPGAIVVAIDPGDALGGAVADRRRATTPDRIGRMIERLTERVSAPTGPEPPAPVIALVDGWGHLREEYVWLDSLQRIAERGMAANVRLVVATHRWSDLRPAMRDLLIHRVELRLGDPIESEIDRRLSAQIPPQTPGRGLVAPGHFVQLALDSRGDLQARRGGPPVSGARPVRERLGGSAADAGAA